MILCDKCKTKNEDASDFCEYCGEKLTTRTLCCPECGLFNKTAARFCNTCGTNLQTGVKKKWILENRYEIKNIIKSGGMGAVYKAVDTRLGIRVAVKKLFNNGSNTAEIQEYQKMFEREAKILASLHHSNLPKVNDYFSAPDDMGRNSNFLVMSLIEGEDLETYLSKNKPPLSYDIVQSYILKILDILEYLHSQNPPVVYRDLKPSNIMHNNGTFFLIDFGIAKALETGKTGTMIGTAGYASPDQCKGNDHLSNDIYSLGVLFHYLLTGINPEAKNTNLFTFEPVRKYNSQLPEHIENLIESMVAIRIGDRPESVKEVREKLEKMNNRLISQNEYNKPNIFIKTNYNCTETFEAVNKGDLNFLADALSNGFDVNYQYDGWTLLHEASSEGYNEITKFLIMSGADINITDDQNCSPLHRAVIWDQLETSQILINHGAQINIKDNEGCTPLHRATIWNHIRIVKLLISKGANINTQDKIGYSALHWAAEKNFKEIVQLLLNHQADYQIKDIYGKTPFEIAESLGNSEIYEILASNITKNDKTQIISKDIFLESIKKGDIELVKRAINQGIDINTKDQDGCTGVNLLGRFNNIEILQLLIANNANLNAKNSTGSTSLHRAAANNLNEVATILILNGAKINIQDNNGQTPLHKAADYGASSVAELLVKHGADDKIRDLYGNTPLMLAQQSNSHKICNLLKHKIVIIKK